MMVKLLLNKRVALVEEQLSDFLDKGNSLVIPLKGAFLGQGSALIFIFSAI